MNVERFKNVTFILKKPHFPVICAGLHWPSILSPITYLLSWARLGNSALEPLVIFVEG